MISNHKPLLVDEWTSHYNVLSLQVGLSPWFYFRLEIFTSISLTLQRSENKTYFQSTQNMLRFFRRLCGTLKSEFGPNSLFIINSCYHACMSAFVLFKKFFEELELWVGFSHHFRQSRLVKAKLFEHLHYGIWLAAYRPLYIALSIRTPGLFLNVATGHNLILNSTFVSAL